MRVTPHSTLAIITCALALLSQISSIHSYGGFFNKEGDAPLPFTSAQQHVEDNMHKYGLSKIRWCGGNKRFLRLAQVTWNNQAAFMKCDRVTKEVKAFRELLKAKSLTSLDTVGRRNVMDPLHQFSFDKKKDNDIEYYCHLYSYIDGETLDEYFKRHTISEAYITTSQILPEVIKGSIYLYNAGIIHRDLYQKNIMLEKNPAGGKPIVKIIDFDSTDVFEKGQDWRPIDPINETYLSSNPPQQSASCNELKNAITGCLKIFVALKQGENPYAPNYAVTAQAVLGYLNEFRENEDYAALQSGDLNVAIPAMHYFLKVYYTAMFGPSACTTPIRILREQPPRAGTPSRPVSPTF